MEPQPDSALAGRTHNKTNPLGQGTTVVKWQDECRLWIKSIAELASVFTLLFVYLTFTATQESAAADRNRALNRDAQDKHEAEEQRRLERDKDRNAEESLGRQQIYARKQVAFQSALDDLSRLDKSIGHADEFPKAFAEFRKAYFLEVPMYADWEVQVALTKAVMAITTKPLNQSRWDWAMRSCSGAFGHSLRRTLSPETTPLPPPDVEWYLTDKAAYLAIRCLNPPSSGVSLSILAVDGHIIDQPTLVPMPIAGILYIPVEHFPDFEQFKPSPESKMMFRYEGEAAGPKSEYLASRRGSPLEATQPVPLWFKRLIK